MILLKSICSEIFSGQAFQGRIETDPEGDCRVVQMRDIDKTYSKIQHLPHLVKSEEIPFKQFLQTGDVLFIAKGSNNYAFVFDENYKAVASSVFFVLRPDMARANSYYIAWYINKQKAQAYLHIGKEGSSVTNINKNTLEHLPVELPPMELQAKIARVHQLLQKEVFLTKAILKKKELFIENILLTNIH